MLQSQTTPAKQLFQSTQVCDENLKTTILTLENHFLDIVTENGKNGGVQVTFIVDDGYLCQIIEGYNKIDKLRKATEIEASLYASILEMRNLLSS